MDIKKQCQYRKWIWQYQKRIKEYQERTDLNAVKKKGMIANAKYKIRVYKMTIARLKKDEKPPINSIVKFTETFFDCHLEAKNKPLIELMCFCKYTLENDYQATFVAKSLNCGIRTPANNRRKLNLLIKADKEAKNTYNNYKKYIAENSKQLQKQD